jgi:RHS repeat-associated protein
VTNTADLTFNLKNPSGAVVATTRSSSGSASLSYLTPSGGNYNLEIVNNSTDTDVPSYSESWSLNSTMTLALKDSTGAVIQQDTTGAKPKTITRSLTAGRYTISATPTGGIGTATVTASYPGRPAREVLSADGNDRVTTTDDGTNTTSETLSPSGRVLRRVVTDDATGQVSEDTTFGYDSDSDSPAYSKPTAGGAVTTYIASPGGLLAIDTGGTPTYPITNAHGDVVGTTDANGAYTANPTTDEFGVGTTPANRLGWRGGKERFSTGGNLGLVRLGVRLYDPNLGRFLEQDPVAGGSANDYDFGYQDPINNFDDNGRYSYNHSYDIGVWGAGADARAMALIRRCPNCAFPFRVRGGRKGHYRLYLPLLGVQNVTMSSQTSTSFTFTAGSGHFAGAGSTISFRTSVNSAGHLMLNVSARGRSAEGLATVPFSGFLWGIMAMRLTDAMPVVCCY